MRQNKQRAFLKGFMLVGALTVFFVLSSFLAPIAAELNSLNPYYFLNWGAPAIFYEDVDHASAIIKLEPWRLLGLQLPAFAGIKPPDWDPPVPVLPPVEPPDYPVTPPIQHELGIVAIYHSHASEAFVPSAGEARSTDFSQTVVHLGNVVEEILTSNGIQVVHNQEYHDQAYNQSYVRSRKTVQDILNQEKTVMLLMDMHRDGVGTTSAIGRAATTCTIGNQKAGQIMLVISTAHENWHQNYRLANDLHNLMENKYPGLSRGILSRENSTYNQDLHTGAILVEVGGHWNTLAEAEYGARLFAEILVDYYGRR